MGQNDTRRGTSGTTRFNKEREGIKGIKRNKERQGATIRDKEGQGKTKNKKGQGKEKWGTSREKEWTRKRQGRIRKRKGGTRKGHNLWGRENKDKPEDKDKKERGFEVIKENKDKQG